MRFIARSAERITNLTGRRRAAAAALAGLVSVLAMAPFNFFPVLFVSIPALIWLIDGAVREADQTIRPQRTRIKKGAFLGWLFAVGYFSGGWFWIGHAFLVDAERFAALMPVMLLTLIALMALYGAAAGALAAAAWRPGSRRVIIFALAWVIFEYLRGHLFTGFPWNLFGYAFAGSNIMIQPAALIGIYGLSLLALVIAALPAVFYASEGFATKHPVQAGLWAAALLISLSLYGTARLIGETQINPAETVQLRIIQPNIKQQDKWRPENKEQILRTYMSLTSSPGIEDIDIVIWPEVALPFVLDRNSEIRRILGSLLPREAVLVTGSIRYSGDSSALKAYNSVMVINPAGQITALYDKAHLVPYGEYLPFKKLLNALGLEKLTNIRADFSAGPGPRTLQLPNDTSISPLICYEIIFPGQIVDPASRPHWIANLTNDAWFGDLTGPYQHFQKARLRAIEQGLPVIRAANTGISAVIDGYGRVLQALALNETGMIDAVLPPPLAPPPYARFGDLMLLPLLLLAAGLICWPPRPRPGS